MKVAFQTYLSVLGLMGVVAFGPPYFISPYRISYGLKLASEAHSPFVFNLENLFPLHSSLATHAPGKVSPSSARISGVFAVADESDSVLYVGTAIDVVKALTHIINTRRFLHT